MEGSPRKQASVCDKDVGKIQHLVRRSIRQWFVGRAELARSLPKTCHLCRRMIMPPVGVHRVHPRFVGGTARAFGGKMFLGSAHLSGKGRFRSCFRFLRRRFQFPVPSQFLRHPEEKQNRIIVSNPLLILFLHPDSERKILRKEPDSP